MQYLVIRATPSKLEKVLNQNLDKELYGIFPENFVQSSIFNIVYIINS